MTEEEMSNSKFVDFFHNWVMDNKRGSIRNITLDKYKSTEKNLREIAPDVLLKDIDRRTYQDIINKYAETHEKVTTTGFHHHLKACLMDAFDDGIIQKNPTRKVVLKGKKPANKKKKYLSQEELEKLLKVLDLQNGINDDWLIMLVAKTGLRYEEVLGLTVRDFDFEKMELNIDKTLDYKKTQKFDLTKNESSVRKVKIDWKTAMMFSNILKDLKPDKRIFDYRNIMYNSTINAHLKRKCEEAGITVITLHGLRHTHASVLLYNGVSVSSIAKRLGHSSTETTQKVYLHLIDEMQVKDEKKIMSTMMEIDY